LSALVLYRLHTQGQRLGQHHHAWTSPKGTIVNAFVGALRKVSGVPKPQIDALQFKRTPVHPQTHEGLEEFLKKRDDI
jgi:hypothetical protein